MLRTARIFLEVSPSSACKNQLKWRIAKPGRLNSGEWGFDRSLDVHSQRGRCINEACKNAALKLKDFYKKYLNKVSLLVKLKS
jgi:hypothetical protein